MGGLVGYNDAKELKPEEGKIVEVILSNGEEAVGFWYDTFFRCGWKCNRGDGLFSNHAWGGIFVTHWKE